MTDHILHADVAYAEPVGAVHLLDGSGGALRGGWVNVLITDLEMARRLVEASEGHAVQS